MAIASSHEEDFESCESVVLGWRDGSISDGSTTIEAQQSSLQNLLFFLHVPRSGGRSFFHCFLRHLFRNLECPCSYGENLPFDPSESKCRVFVAHRGYDLTSKLPMDKTSVLTVLRHPVARVLSSYEKAVEWGARFLAHAHSASAAQITEKFRREWRDMTVLDAWPWNYLLPWTIEDLFARRNARGNERVMEEIKNPYDIEEIVMPLHAFINDPLAHELIHNGATFQVAGLTNNSCLKDSHAVRRCVQKHPSLGRYVLDVAKERLEKMFHIALTEKHKESARMFAEAVGAQAISELQALASQPKAAANNGAVDQSRFLIVRSMLV
ncbi:protein-tyrosine sulfotransferase-like [Nymphaea colorata]|nr:protein-tyrosine sulfotransferase-like [Nymphaea colorata]